MRTAFASVIGLHFAGSSLSNLLNQRVTIDFTFSPEIAAYV
jgi:hypothetical protein